MKHEKEKKGTKFNSSLFFKSDFKVCLVILIFSIFAFIVTFTFDQVPPILNRGIQPATFPKILLILIICLISFVYFLSIKSPWSVGNKLEKPFYLTLFILLLFVFIAKFLDFFLAIGTLSFLISYFWGEGEYFIIFVYFVSLLFLFFETILD